MTQTGSESEENALIDGLKRFVLEPEAARATLDAVVAQRVAGKDIRETLENLSFSTEALRPFIFLLSRSKESVDTFLKHERFSDAERETIENLWRRYYDSVHDDVLAAQAASRGAVNHITGIAIDKWYSQGNQTLLIRTELYSGSTMLIRITEEIDDVLWIIERLVRRCNEVLGWALDQRVQLNETHKLDVLERLDSLSKELSNLVELRRKLAD